jgi:anti-sigma B factor antagonist
LNACVERGRAVPVNLRLTDRTVGACIVVDVAGEIDVSTADELRQRLTGHLDEGRTDLVVNLSGVEFMDSTGLGVLVGVLKRTRSVGGRLQLVVASERLSTLLRITALEQVFTIRPTVEDATAA